MQHHHRSTGHDRTRSHSALVLSQATFKSLGWKTICISVAMGGLFGLSSAKAEEPATQFLKRLREEGLADWGLRYLEISDAKNRLPAHLKQDLPLERILLIQDSLKSVKNVQQRDERVAAIEKGLKDFIASSPNHPRRSETQIKLGDLLLDRASSALNDSKKDENKGSAESLRVKARDAYTEVLALYQKITEELRPLLESMAGDKIKSVKIDGMDLKQLQELREQKQTEYRQAQILQAKTMEFIAQTFDAQSSDWKSWLEKSEAALSAIIDKTTSAQEAGRRMLSLLYRGEVQSQLGKIDEARDSFSRVADNEGADIFKIWRVQAIAGMVRLDSTEKSGKYEAAIQRGDDAIKTATAKDRDDPEWLDLQLATAEARLAWLKTLDEKKDEGKYRNTKRVAREALQYIVKKNGPHQAKAKKYLSELGIEIAPKDTTKLPDTKTFTEAFKAGREWLERAETSESQIQILEQQLEGASPEQRDPILAQIETAKTDTQHDRIQAIELYQRAMKLFNSKDSREDLLEAKFLMSYLYLKTEQYWEAVALSQELLVSGKGSDKAERAGGFALMGMSRLVADASPDRQMALVPSLEKLANYLLETNPNSPEGNSAIELLVKLSLIHKKFDDAEKYVAKSSGGGSGSSILGQVLWSDYRQKLAEHKANKTEPTSEDLALAGRAERLLRTTWDSLDPETVDKNLAMGVNVLAALYLNSDRINEALQVLDEPNKGAMAIVGNHADLDAATKLEAYRLKLQAMVQSAANGGQELSAENVSKVVSTMKDLSQGNDSLLTASLRNLAVELVSQTETIKAPEQRAKLGDAFSVLAKQLVALSNDVNTLDWVGSTVYSIASAWLKDPALATKGKQAMAIADEAFAKLAAIPEQQLTDAHRKPEQIQLKLALAKSGAGKFEEAHKLLSAALAKSPSNLTIQVEAAKNLQAWAEGKNADLLNKALNGTDPNEKRANTVWGWGQISRVTSSRIDQHGDVFFEARYNIAACRRQLAQIETKPDMKAKLFERALSDIGQVYQVQPGLGGPEMLAKFEKLAFDIQQESGKPTVGLQEFKK